MSLLFTKFEECGGLVDLYEDVHANSYPQENPALFIRKRCYGRF